MGSEQVLRAASKMVPSHLVPEARSSVEAVPPGVSAQGSLSRHVSVLFPGPLRPPRASGGCLDIPMHWECWHLITYVQRGK